MGWIVSDQSLGDWGDYSMFALDDTSRHGSVPALRCEHGTIEEDDVYSVIVLEVTGASQGMCTASSARVEEKVGNSRNERV